MMSAHLSFIRCLRSFSKLLNFFFCMYISISGGYQAQNFNGQKHIISFYLYVLRDYLGLFKPSNGIFFVRNICGSSGYLPLV